MFTGIIEEMGVVKTVGKTLQGSGVTIFAKTVLEGLKVGDSVTVNGVCLTVVGCDASEMKADISSETLKVTALGVLQAGDQVNLETDLIGKYVERLFPEHGESSQPDIKIDRDYLQKRGLL